ncbi:berberine bridge enzyme-like 18 [Phoenix dactylifera]|uniref:Berberine bridge enzyme-like 18 n=1 Tax=Phoenix dactylifera TaxID=42345 RepID=A0A8B7C234_PHODC|nr:berberine bridge enzyme-like 18 [Phoenix dactylifera]
MATSYANVILCSILLITVSANSNNQGYASFLQCLSLRIPPSTNISQILHTPDTTSYSSLYLSSIRNLRFVTPETRKPLLIITPIDESHVQASVVCCKEHSFQIRVRSGGHDYEGLSYRIENESPFVIIDLVNLRSVAVDPKQGTAWVQAGATLGELYFRIAEESESYGFPAGVCPTVGVGGHISSGGFGTMLRKYGLAIDNVLDARLVDVNGRVVDKESMGEDLFWAIRGGGGASFGIIVSWKLKLVLVPPTVTAFTIRRASSEGAVELVDKWQQIAPGLQEDLFIRAVVQAQGGNSEKREVEALFNSLFLGRCGELLQLMTQTFPELNLKSSDCKEMNWIRSVLYFAHGTDEKAVETLLDRGSKPEKSFKAKSDFVNEPIPRLLWERIWEWFLEDGAGMMIMDPYGGKISSISDSATPFPHRQGILYNIQYYCKWWESEATSSEKYMGWIRKLYGEMSPYVSQNPRAAYLGYRDLDLGKNDEEGSKTRYSKAVVWGRMYFKDNFERLAIVKGTVDPSDFFRNEQSIPPLESRSSGWRFREVDSRAHVTVCVVGIFLILR